MRTGTTTQRLIDHLLGGKLEEFVRTRRDRTRPLSWRRISMERWQETGEDVAYETLRAWYPDDRNAGAA